jgi:hypothetical protein
LARHRKGLEAVDPVTGKLLLPPKLLHATCDPHHIAMILAEAVGGSDEKNRTLPTEGEEKDAQYRGKKALECFDHFTVYELETTQAVSEIKSTHDDTIRYDTIRYDTIRYDTIRYYIMLYDTTLCYTILHYTLGLRGSC